MFIGTAAGVALGSIPGLTPTMGVAVLVPFTFTLGPTSGLLLLGAVYGGAVYGGSITAVLLNIPGAPANLSTTWDGYPMAQRGEGRRAIHISIVASVIGGLVGYAALLFLSPPLAELSLRFGPAENFWLAVLGITIIASLASRSLIKGLMSGAFGVLLGTVGVSTITGTQRFTFGWPLLEGGIDLVAGMIGLFAVGQTLQTVEDRFAERRASAIAQQTSGRTFLPALRETVTRVRFWLLGSVLGTIIGAIPGAGGQVAGPVGYNEARRWAKNKDEWGTGTPEGIIASEASNNAMVGASLIPMMTLGIPGSPTAAVLLGGLIVHGLFPGIDLFTRDAGITYVFMVGMLITQFMLLAVAVAGAPLFAKVLQVPVHYLAPGILTVSVFGAYAVRQNLGDMMVAMSIGLLMYLGFKAGFDPASITLGLVLGPIAEQNLVLSIRAGQAAGGLATYFFSSVLSATLIALVVLSIAATAVREFKRRRTQQPLVARETSEPAAPSGVPDSRQEPSGGAAVVTVQAPGPLTEPREQSVVGVISPLLNLGVSLGVLAFAALAYLPLRGESWEFAVWPALTLAALAVLAFMQTAISGRKLLRERASGIHLAARRHPSRRTLVAVALTVAYTLAALNLGFYATSVVFMLVFPFLFISPARSRNWVRSALVAFGFVALLYIAFERFLQVLMPSLLLG